MNNLRSIFDFFLHWIESALSVKSKGQYFKMSPVSKQDGSEVYVEHRESSSEQDTYPNKVQDGDAYDGEDAQLLSPDIRASAERRLVRKLDSRLLPTIVLIFIMNYIDVSNHINHVDW